MFSPEMMSAFTDELEKLSMRLPPKGIGGSRGAARRLVAGLDTPAPTPRPARTGTGTSGLSPEFYSRARGQTTRLSAPR